MRKLNKNNYGFSLIEVLVAVGIFGIFASTLISAFILARESSAAAGKRARAGFIAEEGVEAVRNIRDSSFANLVDGTNYGLRKTSSPIKWELAAGHSDVTDGFTRTIEIANTATAKKKITVTVAWQQTPQRTGEVVIETYLARWNWGSPTSSSLPDFTGQPGEKIKVVDGYAQVLFTSASSSHNYWSINVSDNSKHGTDTANAANGNLDISGDYTYLASADSNGEFRVIDISDLNAPVEVANLNLSGTGKAYGIAVKGNRAYVVREYKNPANTPEFVLVDISNPLNPTTLAMGNIELPEDVNDVCVNGNYAYVASSDLTKDLQVIDVSNELLPIVVGTINLPSGNTYNAKTIACAGSTVYIGIGNGDLYSVNVADPANPIQLDMVDTTPSVNAGINDMDLGLLDTALFIGTSRVGQQIQLIDISDPANLLRTPDHVYSAPDGIMGVDYYPETDCLYTVGIDNISKYYVLCSG